MDKKVERIIKLYSRFLDGRVINKKEEAERFEVNQRTIQRDIDDIRMCFANDMKVHWQIVYDRNKKGYILIRDCEEQLNGEEILMLCKVFLQSKVLVKEEMFSVIEKLIQVCLPYEERKKVASLLTKEKMCYEEPNHGKHLQKMMKDMNDAIYTQRLVQIQCLEEEKAERIEQVVQPTGVICHNNYFYLTAYAYIPHKNIKHISSELDELSIVFRLDKIVAYKVLQQHFHIPYKNQYEKSNFRSLIEKEIAVSKEEL